MSTFPPGKWPLQTQSCFVFMFLKVCLSCWSFLGHRVSVNIYMLNEEQKKGKVKVSMYNTHGSTLVNHFARVIGWNLAYFRQYTYLLNLSLMLTTSVNAHGKILKYKTTWTVTFPTSNYPHQILQSQEYSLQSIQ